MDADFDSFYATAAPSLQRLAVALTGDVHAASDLTQDVLVKLLRAWDRLHVDNPHAYARTMLVRQVATSRRTGFLHRERPTAEVTPIGVVADFAELAAESDRLVAALRKLPPRQRQAVVLRYLEDLSTEQTAEAMGCSSGTVKRAAHDGLNSLRNQLTEPAER